MMFVRRKLRDRRHHDVIMFRHGDHAHAYTVGFGRDVTPGPAGPEFGPVLEVFLNHCRVDSELDAVASDGAILLSFAVQYGCPLDTIVRAMKRNRDGSFSSPLGAAADHILTFHREQTTPATHEGDDHAGQDE